MWKSTTLFRVAVLLLGTWQSSDDLILTWGLGAKFDYLGWLALCIWLIPWVLAFRKWQVGPFLLAYLSLFFSAIGMLGDLNVLQHLGLTLALVSFHRLRGVGIIWVFGAVSWMPVFGWLWIKFLPDPIFAGRLALAGLSAMAFGRQIGKGNNE